MKEKKRKYQKLAHPWKALKGQGERLISLSISKGDFIVKGKYFLFTDV